MDPSSMTLRQKIRVPFLSGTITTENVKYRSAKLLFREIVRALCFSIACTAYAYDADKMGEAAGLYLYPYFLIEEFKSAGCAYVFRNRWGVKEAIREAKQHLAAGDARELDSFLPTMQQDARETVRKFFAASRKDGLDSKTLCGLAVGVVAEPKRVGDSRWERAKRRYGYR